mgnify:FL=1|jgi:hypothetical protein
MDLKQYNLPTNSMIGGVYIPGKICDHLIHLFQINADKHTKGVVGPHPARVNEDIKTSTELVVDPYYQHETFIAYRKNLDKAIMAYEKKYPELEDFSQYGMIETCQIQHYKPGEGFKGWHFERSNKKDNRCLVFMTYLNTVPDAGTHFKYQDITTPAEKGLTLIWPPDFTHTHKGQISKTKEKFIITGWLGFA